MTQHILLVGSSELARRLEQSPRVGKVSVIPGETSVDDLVNWAVENKPTLTVINSNAALAAGVVDAFQAARLRVFGPTKAAARIVTSSAFAKQFMQRHNIPTVPFAVFGTFRQALGYLLTEGDQKLTIRGNGSDFFMTDCSHDAETAARELMVTRAVTPIVIEAQSEGKQTRVTAFGDGTHIRALTADSEVLQATIDALRVDGTPFVGIIGATLEEERILAYHIGFDNLTRLKTDLVDVIDACLNGTLDEIRPDM